MRSAVRVQFWNKNVPAPHAVVVHAEKTWFILSIKAMSQRAVQIFAAWSMAARATQLSVTRQLHTRRQMRSAVRVQFWNKNVLAPQAVVVHAEKVWFIPIMQVLAESKQWANVLFRYSPHSRWKRGPHNKP
jgi:hypothetical protein